MMRQDIFDLRSALTHISDCGYEINIVNESLSKDCEISGHFYNRGVGVPGTSKAACSPTIYTNVVGHSMPVLIGLMSERAVCARIIGCDCNNFCHYIAGHINADYSPRIVETAPCQEVVIKENVSVNNVLPILTFTPHDAGPYINMGLVYARNSETGESDVTIHRLCVLGDDELSIYFVKGRHIESFYEQAKALGKELPVTINIGLDPLNYLVSTFSYPITPLGFNELNIAGSIRRKPVELARAVTVDTECIANAEIVIEGYITNSVSSENRRDADGFSLPEFLGYAGRARKEIPVIRVTAITHRKDAIYQTLIGPGSELSNICGISSETAIYKFIKETVTGNILNCVCPESGGGKLFAILQFRKMSEFDDVMTRQAGVAAFNAFHELKHVILVDEDINIYNEKDVLWAMTTRFQGNSSQITMENLSGHPLDPSQSPSFAPGLTTVGATNKTVFDCTIPYRERGRFSRPKYYCKGAK